MIFATTTLKNTAAIAGAALEWGFSGKLLPGSQGEVFYEVLVE